MVTTIIADYTLAAGQVIASSDEDAVLVRGSEWRNVVFNGQITVAAPTPGYPVFAMRVGGEGWEARTVTLGQTSTISLVSTGVSYVGAISAGGTSGPNIKVVNHGAIAVSGVREASGVSVGYGGFENHGTLSVEGPVRAVGVSLVGGEGLTNTGTIRVAPSAAVGGSVGVQAYGYTVIVNHGLIEADRAIQIVTDGPFLDWSRNHKIFNMGVLRGEVRLDNQTPERVALHNAGRIEGAVTLNTGNDLYDGASGTVTGAVKGGAGADTLIGGAGAETLQGGEGDDVIDGGAAGADALDGGAGLDLLTFDGAAAGVTLDVTLLTGSRGLRFADFEAYVGSRHADSFKGGAAADVISAGEGADTVLGGAGDDRIEGGNGRNYLRGEEGHDSLVGGSEFDDLHGNVGHDTVSGGDGDDWVVGGQDHDLLYGDAGSDVVLGNLGNDTVRGGEGSDVVRGGQGDDLIRGEAGDDYVAGDRGADTIYGGAGADLFHTFSGAGMDRVLDFNGADGDRVNVLAGSSYTLRQEGADTIVDMSNGDQVVLVGVTLSTLPAGWIFVS